MSRLEIDTGEVKSVASEIGKRETYMSRLADIISNDDVSNDDGFDFGSAKTTILKSIRNCTEKIKNTKKIMTIVADSHDKIQNTLKYEVPKSSWEN